MRTLRSLRLKYSRHWNNTKYLVDDLVARHVLRLGLVGEEDAVAKDVVHDFLHVLRRRVGATVHKRVATGGEVQGERRARRGAILDHRVGLARLEYDLEDVVANLLVAVDVVQRGAKRLDVAGSADRLRLRLLGGLGKALHDAPLVGLRRRGGSTRHLNMKRSTCASGSG